jgi:glutamyl/glutaminyl-tRNA synthetase
LAATNQGRPVRYDGHCRNIDPKEAAEREQAGEPCAVRVPCGDVDTTFTDLVRGDITIPAGSFGDVVVRRRDGSATYQLASIVDDVECMVTRVLRGADHIESTARQLAIAAAMERMPPSFGHLPLLLGADGSKFSKRHGASSIDAYLQDGMVDALRAYMMELLGHDAVDPLELPPGGGWFMPGQIPVSGPRFDAGRIDSIARSRLAARDAAELADIVAAQRQAAGAAAGTEASRLQPLVADLVGEARTTGELAALVATALGEGDPTAPAELTGLAATQLTQIVSGRTIDSIDVAKEVTQALKRAASEHGVPVGALLGAARHVLTGRRHGAGLAPILLALGELEVQQRAAQAAVAGTIDR